MGELVLNIQSLFTRIPINRIHCKIIDTHKLKDMNLAEIDL